MSPQPLSALAPRQTIDGHTAGPWQVETANGRLPIVRRFKQPHGEADTYGTTIRSVSGEHVCRLDFGYGQTTDEANARLLSAAPDMLSALDDACEFLSDRMDVVDGEDGQPRPDRFMSLYTALDEVRAKARGERWPR